MHSPELVSKIKNAPMKPGCYLFRDSMGNVIYVGKAKVLRNRVRQYFQKRREDDNPKLENLVRVIADVEYHVTPTERDALMLEYRFIKQYKPMFNAQLVATPRQLFLRIDSTAQRPTLTISEQTTDDGADYFGYFRDRYDAQDAIALLNAVWRTPVCCKASFDGRSRPCVQREVGRCMAPCGQSLDESAYRAAIDEIVHLLRGERPPVFGRLEAEMMRHAGQMNYKKAAASKTHIDQLERLRRRSRFMSSFPDSGDVLVFLRVYREDGYSLFLVRDGSAITRMDLECAPDEGTIQHLFAQAPLPDSDWPPGCLIELYADKLFLPLRNGTEHALIFDAYQRFASRLSTHPATYHHEAP